MVASIVSALVTGGCTGMVTEGAPETSPLEEAPDAGPPADPSAAVFDETTILNYHLAVAPADWQWLNEHALDESYVPATVRFQEETYANAAVRYKGNSTLKTCFDNSGNRRCKKASLKVSFNEYDDRGRFHGLKKLQFASMVRDPSNMRDAISFKLFRDMGVAAPRTAYARVTVNGEYLGLFLLVEYVDGRFTRRVFPDGGKGNLYKEAWPGPEHLNANYFLGHLRTNEDDNPSVDRMVRFAAELADAGEYQLVEVTDRWLVTDQLMRYMAVARLIDHWDGVVGWYCSSSESCRNHNFYWYESAEQDQVWLIPWDMDHTLTASNPFRQQGVAEWDEVAASCELITREGRPSWRSPSCDLLTAGLARGARDLYVDYSLQLINGDFSSTAINVRIDQLQTLLAKEIAADPNEDGTDEWLSAVSELRTATATKRVFISGRL